MKITSLLLFIGCLSISAASHSQEVTVSLKMKNKSINQVFDEIQRQTSYSFWFETNDVDITKKVSVNAEKETVETVLENVLKDQNVDFSLKGNHILIVKKGASESKVGNKIVEKKEEEPIKITGVVTDEQKIPIIGASVIVKGTTNGAISDLDGDFTLKVQPKDIVLISYIGYASQEIVIDKQQFLNIVLRENLKALDEVVVIGYGMQKKVNLTGAVAMTDAKLLRDRPMSNLSAGLAGAMPGINVAQQSGLPGHDDGTIRVRGVGTLNNSSPMIIVDGIESTMTNLDANDIESITVLKDAASAAIYGSKASNGVILITTKKGKAGVSKVNYSGYVGWQSPTSKPKYMKSYEYASLFNEALENEGSTKRWTDAQLTEFKNGEGVDTDWQDLLYQGSGFQTGHNVSATGGSQDIRYMASLGYLEQKGIIKNAGKNQYNFRTNLDIKLTSNLEAGFNVSYTRMDLEEPTNSYVGGGIGQILKLVNKIAPWVAYKTDDGNYGSVADGNPIAWLDINQKIKRKRAYFTGIGSLNYKPISDLTIRGMLSYKTYNQDENEFIKDIYYTPTVYQGPNKMYQKVRAEETVMTDLYSTYEKTLGEVHNFSVMGGFHSEYFHLKDTEAYREIFPNNNVGDIDAGGDSGKNAKGYTRELAMLSWFGRATYNYNSRYLFEANIRYDGTSRFAKGNRWGAFPSLSAAWRITEEAFMESVKQTLTNLKLRASWGKLGNQSAVDDYYPTIMTLTSKDQSYPMGGNIATGAASINAKNPDLKWETSRTWDFGLDFSFSNGINVTLDYYDRLTTDIIMKIPTPDTYALKDYWGNTGEVSNKGVELSIDYNKQVGNVMLSFGGNVSYNKNEIKYLGGQTQFQDPDNYRLLYRVGSSINSIYGYGTSGLYRSNDGLAPNGIGTPQRGDLIYVDADKNGKLNSDDKIILGSTDPKYTFGFNLGATYKGFDILAFFQGAAGVKGYLDIDAYGSVNGDSGKASTFWRDRWHQGNPNANVPRVSSKGASGYSAPNKISEFWTLNANYLRMKNLQIGYTFPRSVTSELKIEKLRLYYSGQNLFSITNFTKGFDPESPLGTGSHYPQVMVNSAGINITF